MAHRQWMTSRPCPNTTFPRRRTSRKSRTRCVHRSARRARTSTTGCATTPARTRQMLAYLQRRERLRRRADGAAAAAAGDAVRGDRRPHQAGRQLGAVPRARLLVLHALRDRPGLSDPRAPQGQHGGAGGSPARRQRDGRGQGLLQRRRLRESARTTRCSRGPRTPSAAASTRSASATSPPATTLPDEIARRGRQPGLGRRQPHAVLRRERSGDAAHGAREEACARHAGQRRRRWCTRKTTTASTWASTAAATTSYICITSKARCPAKCATRRRPIRSAFTVLAPRERDVEYQADHLGDRWVIRTNADGATNFKLVTAPSDATSRAQWQDWIAAPRRRLHRRLRAVRRLHRHRRALRTAWSACACCAWPTASDDYVQADEPAYCDGPGRQRRTGHRLAALRLHVADHAGHDLRAQHAHRRAPAAQAAAGASATTRRATSPSALWATARDGTRVPVSLVYRKGFSKDGTAALLQYAYGSYGSSTDPALQPAGGEPARPRHGLRDRAHPRRPGNGPRLVRRRQAAAQEEHLHRLHRRHRFPGEAKAMPRRIASPPTAAAPAAC